MALAGSAPTGRGATIDQVSLVSASTNPPKKKRYPTSEEYLSPAKC